MTQSFVSGLPFFCKSKNECLLVLQGLKALLEKTHGENVGCQIHDWGNDWIRLTIHFAIISIEIIYIHKHYKNGGACKRWELAPYFTWGSIASSVSIRPL